MKLTIPTPEKPMAPGHFLALRVLDPKRAKAILSAVLLAERSIPNAAKALGLANGTLRKLRAEDGQTARIVVRGRGRPPGSKTVDS